MTDQSDRNRVRRRWLVGVLINEPGVSTVITGTGFKGGSLTVVMVDGTVFEIVAHDSRQVAFTKDEGGDST